MFYNINDAQSEANTADKGAVTMLILKNSD